jgi:tetratricopeptide (TPR) repeat protein
MPEQGGNQVDPSGELVVHSPMSKAEYDCGCAPTPQERIKACTLFIRTAKTAQARATGYSNRGRDRDGLGQTKLALKDMDRATQLWPELGGPYLDRAMIRMCQGDSAAAIKEYDALLKLYPNEPSALSSRCWAKALAGTDLDQALADCNHLIRTAYAKATYYEDRAIIWFRRNDIGRAISDADYALSLEPGRARALYLRGLGWAALGQTDQSKADIAAAKTANEAAVAFLMRWGLHP